MDSDFAFIYIFWAPWMFVPGESSTQTLIFRVMDTFDDDDDDDDDELAPESSIKFSSQFAIFPRKESKD